MKSKNLEGADKIKDAILGKEYELSLVFADSKISRRLNKIYRGKDKPTNVLAFPLSKTSGEIFIDLSQAGEFSALHLFIHGLLHLKGLKHGAKMERVEKKFLSQFTNDTSNRRGHRYRHLNN